jgi:hypothetical protein
MKKTILFFSLFSALILSSCATIVSGTTQKISFNSNPSNASIFIDDFEVGKTPFQTKLERKSEHKVVIKLEGYKPYQTKLEKSFNAWYIGNVIFGGLIGLIIDPITGAIYELTPSQVNAQLEQGTVAKIKSSEIFIAVSLEKDPSWKKIGQLEKL